MKRKLVKHGESTMMVSLPAKWLRANNLGKGDELEVEERGKEILINSEAAAKKKREIIIEIKEENKHDIYPILTHAYRTGFDKITLKGNIADIEKEVKSIVNNILLGFEITDKSSDKCLIENISEPVGDKYEIMLKKVFMIIKDMQSVILADFKVGKYDLKEVYESKILGDKFILFCKRILNKQGIDNKTLEWEMLTFLTQIAHAYYYLHKFAAGGKIKPEKAMIELIVELGSYFSLLENAYYEKNIVSIHKINNLKQKFQFGRCLDLIARAKGKEAVVYSYIRELFRLIQISTSPILNEILE